MYSDSLDRAIVVRWTSVGPSARASEGTDIHMWASGVSVVTPSDPCTCKDR